MQKGYNIFVMEVNFWNQVYFKSYFGNVFASGRCFIFFCITASATSLYDTPTSIQESSRQPEINYGYKSKPQHKVVKHCVQCLAQNITSDD